MPICEALETRTVLNGSRIAAGPSVAVLDHSPLHNHTVESRPDCQPAIGSISGRIINTANATGIADIRVQLIGARGRVVRTNWTNARGRYRFKILANGPYVVRAVTPRRFVQTSPTSIYGAPRAGEVWPFQSPINITAPPINLSKYLTITYNDTEEGQVETVHDLEVTIPSSDSDTIDVGGQEFELEAFHYHDPSEDQVDGNAYSMEEQFVNKNASGAVTVLAVFLQPGATILRSNRSSMPPRRISLHPAPRRPPRHRSISPACCPRACRAGSSRVRSPCNLSRNPSTGSCSRRPSRSMTRSSSNTSMWPKNSDSSPMPARSSPWTAVKSTSSTIMWTTKVGRSRA